ncbi:MAG: phage tail tape measure protein [Acidimicrobiia bacterium]|nr:phage tail tape measure protein [Acidimicrobiia bacterium]
MARQIRVEIVGDAGSLQKAFGQAVSGADAFGSRMQSLGASVQSAGRSLTTGLTVPIVGLGALAVKAASDFESSFAGVRKTVDATEPELQALAQGFRDMAKEIPGLVNELNEIGEAAGALGIEKENILSFTRTVADLGEATDHDVGAGGDRVRPVREHHADAADRVPPARLHRRRPREQAGGDGVGDRRDGDAARRCGRPGRDDPGGDHGVGRRRSPRSGSKPKPGGTAMSTVMVKIQAAVNKGGEALGGFAKVSGMSSAEFARAWEQDAAGALVTFIEGLGKMKQAGGDVFGTLEDLGLGSMRSVTPCAPPVPVTCSGSRCRSRSRRGGRTTR